MTGGDSIAGSNAGGRSAFFVVLSVILATALVVQVVGFVIVLTTPTPKVASTGLTTVASLLRDQASDPVEGLRVRRERTAPTGRRSALMELALADLLEVPAERCRIVWIQGHRQDPEFTLQVIKDDQAQQFPNDPMSLSPEQAAMTEGVLAALVSPSVVLPEYSAALQGEDGTWRVVRPVRPLLDGWRVRMIAAFALVMLALVPVAWWVAHRLSEPMRALARAAERLDLTDHQPTALQGPQEARAAAAALDGMRDRLRAQANDRERVVAAMAHDLRTPLTTLRVRAETAPEPDRTRMAEEITRMDRMIADVLAYTRGAAGVRAKEPVDLLALVRGAVEEAALRGSAELGESPAACQLAGEPLSLRRAVGNLIDNAQAYGGGAEVSLACTPDRVAITVADRGPGIDPADADRLLEPFQRGEASRSRSTGGAGLGLSVARDTARAHGGNLVLRNREGGGLEAVMMLATGS